MTPSRAFSSHTARALLFVGLGLGSPLIASAVEIVRDNQTYQVLGTTRDEILAGMRRLAPLDPATGEPRDALTRWELDWRYDTREGVQGCDIARVWTTLKVTTILPRHGAASTLPDDLRQEWTRILQRLTDHEEAHVRIATDAAREVETSLDRLHRPNCATIERDAREMGETIVQRARARERAYDTQSNYGKTEGANFRRAETEGETSQLTGAEIRRLRANPPAPR